MATLDSTKIFGDLDVNGNFQLRGSNLFSGNIRNYFGELGVKIGLSDGDDPQIQLQGDGINVNPHIDFANGLNEDYDARIILEGNDTLTIAGAKLKLNSSLEVATDVVINGGDLTINNNNGGIGFNDSSKYWLKTATNWGLYWNTSTNAFEMHAAGVAKQKFDIDGNTITAGTFYGAFSGNASTATKLKTARTIALAGDASGSITFDGSANKTITVVVNNDSHTHDGRYYTEAESNARYLGKTAKAADSDKIDNHDISQLFRRIDNTTDYKASANIMSMQELNNALPVGLTSAYNYGGLITFNDANSRLRLYAPHQEGTDKSALYFATGWGSDNTPKWERAMTYTDGDAKYLGKTAKASSASSADAATKIASIGTSFSGKYPITINAGGVIYSHGGMTFEGSTGILTSAKFKGALIGNADTSTKLKTARTIALAGDASGSITFDGSANKTITVVVNNDSHTHDGRYYTEAESNAKYSPKKVRSNWNKYRDQVVGQLGWQKYGNNHTIFDASAGTSPTGVAKNNANPDTPWAAGYPTLMGYNGSNTYGVRVDIARKSESCTGNAATATKLATARTIALGGDATGSITFDGTSNKTITVVIKDDSHNHVIGNVDGLQTALNGKAATNHTHSGYAASSHTHSEYLGKTAKAADSEKVDGIDGASLLRSDVDDTFTGKLISGHRGKGLYGVYDSSKTDQIWSMGTAYNNASDGANFGNLYGLAYKHTNNTTGGTMGGGHQMLWVANGTAKCSLGDHIWTSGNVTAYSDARVKENLVKIESALSKVLSVNGYTYDRIDVETEKNQHNPNGRHVGVIAQEILEILPEAVSGGPTDNDPDAHYSVAYGNLTALLIESTKELNTKVESQANKIKSQQSEINELKAMVKLLASKVGL